jgi:hypothetical protein
LPKPLPWLQDHSVIATVSDRAGIHDRARARGTIISWLMLDAMASQVRADLPVLSADVQNGDRIVHAARLLLFRMLRGVIVAIV